MLGKRPWIPAIRAFTRVHSPSKTGVNALNDALCAGTTTERSVPAEQAIEKPAVEAAVDRLRPDGLGAEWTADLRTQLSVARRAGRRGDVRQRRGERRRGRKSRQRCDRHALMGDLHEVGPDVDRQAAASRLLGGGGIVVAEP